MPHHSLMRERIATRVLSATTTVQFMGIMFILDDNGGFVIAVLRLTDGWDDGVDVDGARWGLIFSNYMEKTVCNKRPLQRQNCRGGHW